MRVERDAKGDGRPDVFESFEQQDGKTVYSTRKLPGSVKVLNFTVKTPPGAQAPKWKR